MGNYTKLHVDAVVTGVTEEQIREKIQELRPGSSYYHATGVTVNVSQDDCFKERIEVQIMCQTKYGQRQEEFLNWLKPFVCDGSGPKDIWAMQFNEYSNEPTIWALSTGSEDEWY